MSDPEGPVLLACPFCGGTRFVLHEGRVGCMNGLCGAEASTEAAWNTRAGGGSVGLSKEEKVALWVAIGNLEPIAHRDEIRTISALLARAEEGRC